MAKFIPNQDFIFQHAKIANEAWEKMELAVIMVLRNSVLTNSANVESFKRLAARRKKKYLKAAKRLVLNAKKEFRADLTKEIESMAREGLKMTTSAVLDLKEQAKLWNPHRVSSNKAFFSRNQRFLRKAEKMVFGDVKLTASRILRQLNRTHSHIVQEIVSNVRDLKDNKLFISELREQTLRSVGRVAKHGLPKIRMVDGRQMDVANYSEMVTRANFKTAFNSMQEKRFGEYGIDLVISSYLADSSKICQPYQGNVYSARGDHPGYPSKDYAEADGHTTHLYCRHIWMPYIHNVSIKPPRVSAQTIKKNRNNRLKQRHNERQIRKWRRADVVLNNKKTKDRIAFWEDKQARLIRKNPAMSRDYSREKVIKILSRGKLKYVL